MPRLAFHRLSMAHPGDVAALGAVIEAGEVRAGDIRAVIGKTEGNGGLNDFTRGYFTQSLMLLLASHTGEAPAALAARISCVLSGGTAAGRNARARPAAGWSAASRAPARIRGRRRSGGAPDIPVNAAQLRRACRVPDARTGGRDDMRTTILAAFAMAGLTGFAVAEPAAVRGSQRGEASFYHPERFTGRPMANGDRFDPDSNAAAHRTLPLGTVADVTNLETGTTRRVVIEDRGPYARGRILDVSPRTADELGMREDGTAPVEVRPVGRLPNSARDGRSGAP